MTHTPPTTADSGPLACCDSSQYQNYRSPMQKSPINETIGPLACCDTSQYHKLEQSTRILYLHDLYRTNRMNSTSHLHPTNSMTRHENFTLMLPPPISRTSRTNRTNSTSHLHSTNSMRRHELFTLMLPPPISRTTPSNFPTLDASPTPRSSGDDTHASTTRWIRSPGSVA